MINYYTVSQYAALLNKDVGNIRRLLIKGVLEGEKVGNQWLIPKNAKYPDDNRVKSGQYRNWRKRSEIMRVNPALMKTVKDMCSQIGKIYGEAVDRIVLYGSYARGEASPDSDMDIAVFLKGEDSEAIHDAMTEIVVDHELECGVTLSVVTIEERNYMEWRTTLPYYRNIDKEGIVLWKAA
jgi:excisionase family DNA binding protein